MATVTKVNPAEAISGSKSFIGKDLIGLTIDFAVNATNFDTTENGPAGAVQKVLEVIMRRNTIVGYSDLRADGGGNAGQVFDVYLEGKFGTDTYDGTNSETLAVHLEDEIQALTSVGAGPVNLSNATVTAITGFPLIAA